MNQKFCVGLTGGIGSGKTTVSGMFEKLGAGIIDADTITHELQGVNQPAYQEILREFGPEVIDENRVLRRDYLRQLIYNDRNLKIKLENIVHPLVRMEIRRRLELNDHPYSIVSIPLLVETDTISEFDRIIVIDIPEHMQVQRAVSRDGVSSEDIVKIINAQIERTKRLEMADDIICNDGDMVTLMQHVNRLHKLYLQLAEDKFQNSQSNN